MMILSMCAVAVSLSEKNRNLSQADNLNRDVRPRLKQYILDHNPAANDQTYMCNYCKSGIKKDKLPPCCVLNGLPHST